MSNADIILAGCWIIAIIVFVSAFCYQRHHWWKAIRGNNSLRAEIDFQKEMREIHITAFVSYLNRLNRLTPGKQVTEIGYQFCDTFNISRAQISKPKEQDPIVNLGTCPGCNAEKKIPCDDYICADCRTR